MAQNSKIEWTKHTANLWWGCVKVGTGCVNCYADALAHRWGFDVWGLDKPRRFLPNVWNHLYKYQRDAAAAGEIHRVFIGSMMDIFEKPMPMINSKGHPESIDTDVPRQVLFHDIVPRSPNLLFLFLTKRPSNINKYTPDSWKQAPPANAMFGTSLSDQEDVRLIDQLRQVPGKLFLSVEPMTGAVDLSGKLDGIDWVICGGESGQHKRPFDANWARSLRDQCQAAGVAFFFKQMDKIQAIPEDLMIRQFPAYDSEENYIRL
jgi:protein gp37